MNERYRFLQHKFAVVGLYNKKCLNEQGHCKSATKCLCVIIALSYNVGGIGG